jgi:hypothetical protein
VFVCVASVIGVVGFVDVVGVDVSVGAVGVVASMTVGVVGGCGTKFT